MARNSEKENGRGILRGDAISSLPPSLLEKNIVKHIVQPYYIPPSDPKLLAQ